MKSLEKADKMGIPGSLPSWERGLKFPAPCTSCLPSAVAPLVGAWIEIEGIRCDHVALGVAPLVGAWIEINVVDTDLYDRTESLPSWERGLK